MKFFTWRCLFLFSAVLIGTTSLYLTDKIAISQPTKTDQNAIFAFEERSNKDSTVVNGIEFKAVFSNKPIQSNSEAITQSNTFPIPKKINIETPNSPLIFTEVGVGIYATNKTDKPVYLSAYGDIIASLTKPNGVSVKPEPKHFSGAILHLKPVLIQPRTRVIIPLTGKLYWAENHLELLVSDFPSGPLIFRDVEPGANKLQLTYFNDKDEVDLKIISHSFSTSKESERQLLHPYPSADLQLRRGAWKGKAVLIPIKFNLTNGQE